MAATFVPTMLLAILPEICLLVLGGLLLALDLIWKEDQRRNLGWVTAGGLLLIASLSLVFSLPGDQGQLIFGGMLRMDLLGFVFRMIFLVGGAITALFAMDTETIGNRGEFYLLMAVSILGMSLMASSADLIMLFLAIETTSIPLYILAGFLKRDDKSSEAGLKYLLFGAMTSAIMLYGFSLLAGISGTTQIYAIVSTNQGIPNLILFGVLILVLVGFSFKISAVPFHFWAPDVYEGAPTPITGFLSTASKAAGFAVLMRVLLVAFQQISVVEGNTSVVTLVVAILSIASMTLGNMLALAQKNIKRMLAYSSIAQAGYMLIGVATISPLGFAATTFYLIAYLVTNLAAFGVVSVISKTTGSDEISAYSGLSRRSPGLALILLVALLSLAGIPPFGGFVGKVMVFSTAINANIVWLAVVGILNSIVGLYYYLMVLKVVYLGRSDQESEPLKLTRPWVIALVVCVVGILLLGTIFAPWFDWSF